MSATVIAWKRVTWCKGSKSLSILLQSQKRNQILEQERKKIAGLDCIVNQSHDEVDVVVVVSHGYGANCQDLAPVGNFLLSKTKRKVKLVFPNGIVPLGGESVAWWPLDINRLISLSMNGQFEVFTKERPEGLEAATSALLGLVRELRKQTPNTKLVLAGFSQGAMLSTHLALQLNEEESPNALVILSGALINVDEWKKLAPSKKALKVIQAHGTSDPIVPYVLGDWLRKLLEESGLAVDFISFQGAHTVAPQAIGKIAQLLDSL